MTENINIKMGKDIPLNGVEFRIDNSGKPYLRLKIKTEIINDTPELRDTDKKINIDIIAT